MDQNHHCSRPATRSISGPSARSSAPGGGACQRGSQPSEPEPSHSSDCNRGGSQPEHVDLTKISFLSKSSTSGEGHFQGESENFSEPTTPEGEHSPGVTSSWTWLQRASQEVSVHSGSEQTRQSRLLCLVLSESVSSHSVPPARAPASELCREQEAGEEVAAKAVGSPMSVRPEGSSGLGSFYRRVSDLYRDTSNHLLRAGTRGACGTLGARLPCGSIHREAAVSGTLTPGHALGGTRRVTRSSFFSQRSSGWQQQGRVGGRQAGREPGALQSPGPACWPRSCRLSRLLAGLRLLPRGGRCQNGLCV